MSKTQKPTVKTNSLLMIARPEPTARKIQMVASGDRSALGDVVKKAGKKALEYVEISPEELQVQLSNFLAKMSTVVQNLPGKIGEFSLDSIELSVEITAKGSVGLLGTGGEVGGTGGLTFTLKRKGSS